MSMQDPLADALSHIKNCEKAKKKICEIRPISKVLKKIMTILNEEGYIGDFEVIDDNKGGVMKLNLVGKINNSGAIKPRFSFKKHEIEKYEKRFLPAKDFGILLVTTPKGIMTHIKAKQKNLGGRLLAYVY